MRYVKRTVAVLAACAIALMLPADSSAPGAMKVLATSTREQLEEAQRQKEELEGKHEEVQDDLNDLKGEQKTLQGELNKLNNQLMEVSDNLESLENRIAAKEQDISDAQTALEAARKTEEDQYMDMVLRARKMYENNDANYVNVILGAVLEAGNLSEALSAADGYEKIASYDKKKLEEFKENRLLIEEHEKLLRQEKAELDRLKLDAEEEKNKVSGLISYTSNSITEYADQISEAEEQARAYEAEIKKKEEDVDYLKKKLAEELAMSQAAAQGEWRDISEVTFAEGDRCLLANLIYCEAGGEPYEGQLAVGSVVINRVLSEKFPDSVVGVIYQNRQFSPVASGRLGLALSANKATPSCYKAADEAMMGVTNVGNCVYFRTPVEGLTGITIGGHVFY